MQLRSGNVLGIAEAWLLKPPNAVHAGRLNRITVGNGPTPGVSWPLLVGAACQVNRPRGEIYIWAK